jgi:glycosyltransferase involved in cell wall biosynthesis
VVLATARAVHDKGLDLLVAAAAALPQARVVIAGDGPALPALAAQVAALGLEGRVLLLGWRSDAQALLAACDVFVLPTRNEALGVSVLEAMAAGRPVVATDVGGVPEAVRHGETGLIVPPENPTALAAAIAELIADPSRAARYGAAGHARALARFSPAPMAAAVEDVYERVLDRGMRRSSVRRGAGA